MHYGDRKQSKLSIAFNESQLAGKKATDLDVKRLSGRSSHRRTSGSGFTYRIKTVRGDHPDTDSKTTQKSDRAGAR